MEEEPERFGRGEGNQHEKGARNFRCRCRKEGSSPGDVVFAAIWHHSEPWHENIQFLSRSLYQVIRENPYKLADDIDGVGFRIADEIASKAGILPDSDFRIRSGILYVLEQATGQGHTCLPMDQLMQEARRLLGVEI